MIVTITDIQNAIVKAQNMVYSIALNLAGCYSQGEQLPDEKFELVSELESYIDTLSRVEFDSDDCIDSDDIWNIISWINGNQVLAELCLVIPEQFSNPGQPIPVPEPGCCGVRTVTGTLVDNTDPKNPTVNLTIGSGLAWTDGPGSTLEATGGGGGSGTVTSGAQYRLAYYAAAGNTVSNANAITGSRALKSDVNGVPTHFDTASEPSLTELTYVKGVTSAIQTQLNAKAPIASPTFTGIVTTPAVNVSGLTASELVATDGSKNLQSLPVATYPSLAEMAFVKGLSSAVQTQLNAKVNNGSITGGGLTMNTSRILGRTTAAVGAIEEITIGTGLSLSAGSLTATGAALVEVTGNITAANDTNYIQTASATFSDPTPAEGKGYTVFVRNGTATIGGVTYAAGCLVYRFYHSGAWANTTYFEDSIPIVHQFTAGTNPNDATNYYIGAFPSLALTTSATARKSKLNGNYRIVAANIEIITAGTLGSSENSTLSIRLNNTTDVLVSNTVKFNTVLYQEFVTGLAIDILSTDDFQTKLLTATFATNPTTPYGTITYYAKRIS